ncbi:MAG: oligopeptide transporter, OPT family [Polyangiaceae bacterium]|nr:oligopeptide transporter, OPT family [Polyangiaceae bacterium]
MSAQLPPESGTQGSVFEPFVPATSAPAELNLRTLVIGSLLGIVFAASSVYLGLKVGLTVSASIPVAVLSITLFRYLSKVLGRPRATILENNIVQTTGSAGESLAAGVAFTLPSLLLMGFELEIWRILLVAMLGGLIGVLMMIPMRHGLMVKEHGKLAYPEGTACADVLIVGEQGGTNAKTVFFGFLVGLGYTILNLVTKLWADTASFALTFWGRLTGARLDVEVSPPMLGVGYIIGPRVACSMFAGGMLAFLILIPMIHLFGGALPTPMYPELTRTISQMSAYQIRNAYILYIGAGAVATGGFIALGRALPTLLAAFRSGLADIGPLGRNAGASSAKSARWTPRTELDLPMSIVIGGSLALIVVIWLAPVLEINFVSALLILLFGFFFVTVSSRITGEIGSSSNPISGMTVATLLITCGLFVLIGWVGAGYKAIALTTAALVCVAASNGGTISQDLKTGFLVGATPRAQQIAILVGVVTSSVVIGFTLLLLNQSHTTYRPVQVPDFTAPVAADADPQVGPDGKAYRVWYAKEDHGAVARGKYLADGAGKLQFLVDPGVCGTYEFRLEAKTFSKPLPIPAGAPSELGIDHQMYSVVTTDHAQGEIPAGRYLVAPNGSVAYHAASVWKFDAPKAQLFRLIIDGTLGGKLPWGLVLIGALLAIMMELVGVASLPFAVGLYLPIGTSAGIFVGGMVRWLVDRRSRATGTAAEFSPGVLMASGLIAGGAIAGVGQSVVAFYELDGKLDLSGVLGSLSSNASWWPMAWFLVMAALLYRSGTKRA